jgi:hypothetical protein
MMNSGAAGYRLHKGAPVLLNCNGIDEGDFWGIFGDTVADDGVLNYCRPLLEGCNIEDFEDTGVWNKNGGVSLKRTTFLAPLTGAVRALLLNPDNAATLGELDNDGIFGTKGASWSFSQPVHTSAAGHPFAQVSGAGADTLSWYNNAAAAVQSMTTVRSSLIAANRYAASPFDHYVRGLSRNAYAREATFATSGTVAVTFAGLSLPDLPDDQYIVKLSPGANQTFWVTSKATTGFTINSSSGSSTATVGWEIVLKG